MKKTKYVYEGEFVAAVDVEILEDGTGWSPYLRLEDAHKLDEVRDALRRRDFGTARRYAQVYRLKPIDT